MLPAGLSIVPGEGRIAGIDSFAGTSVAVGSTGSCIVDGDIETGSPDVAVVESRNVHSCWGTGKDSLDENWLAIVLDSWKLAMATVEVGIHCVGWKVTRSHFLDEADEVVGYSWKGG